MEPIIVWYLRMSVIYFVAAAAVGTAMLIHPDIRIALTPIHAHLNLLGFMSMMIYGVGYHILPKFSGVQVYSPKIVRVQFWVANAGLIGMAVSWPLDYNPLFKGMLIMSALLSVLGAVLFAFNILKTIKPIGAK